MAIQQDTKDATATMKRAPVQGGELEYEVRGDGEPVLLIHGSHVAGGFLPLMTEPALEGYRLIRYHRRGFAGSTRHEGPFSIEEQAQDAAAVLDHLTVDTAHVAGHSYGGSTALQLALEAPARVHSLVLLEPGLPFVPAAATFAEEILAPAVERYETEDSHGAVDVFMRGVASPEWREDVVKTVPGGPEQAERDAATFFEVEVPTLDSWSFEATHLDEISQPVLHVLGNETLPMFREGRDLLRGKLPEMEEHVVHGTTHALQMEDPQSVAEGVAGFLKRHPVDEANIQ